MPSSVASGAIYGTGLYGTSLYGVSSIAVLVDGVSATGTLNNTLGISGDAAHAVCGLCTEEAEGFVGVVTLQGNAIVVPTGVTATGSLGTSSQTTVNRVPITGVSATGSIDSVSITGDSNTSITGVNGTGVLGTSVIVAKAITVVTGVSATGSLGTTLQRIISTISVTGVSASGSIDSVSITGDSNTSVAGVNGTGSLGTPIVTTQGAIVVVVTGVSVTSTLSNAFAILENEVIVPSSVFGTSLVGSPTVNTTSFNFEAVASLYNRSRAVYIPRQTTSKERTAIVPAR